MAITFNHTIVAAKDRRESANYFTDVFGLPAAKEFGPFLVVSIEHGASLDFAQAAEDQAIHPQHYAFLVTEDEFDRTFAKIGERGIDHWADPGRQQPSRINRADGGRGVYFPDPDDHLLEIITRPYGSG